MWAGHPFVAYSKSISSAGWLICSGRRGNIRFDLPNVLCNDISFGSVSVLVSSLCRSEFVSCADISVVNGDFMSMTVSGVVVGCCFDDSCCFIAFGGSLLL